jgi:hypothetical protein
MELTTHLTFSVAIGLIFFGKPEIALLMGMGSLLPDLDREYWFMPWKWYRDEQYHRALLHNVFIMTLAYLLSPFLALGIFLHAFQDSFTTVRDRGVEIFYPITRLVRRGWLSGDYVEDDHPPDEHFYFYQEDVLGLVNDADPDLREEGSRPVPWRRIYGFALNGRIVDHWFLFGSVALILVWVFASWPSNLLAFWSYLSSGYIWVVGFAAIALLYASGELDRHDKESKYPRLVPAKYPLIVVGLGTLAFWLILNANLFLAQMRLIGVYWFVYSVGAVLVLMAGLLVLFLERRRYGNAII